MNLNLDKKNRVRNDSMPVTLVKVCLEQVRNLIKLVYMSIYYNTITYDQLTHICGLVQALGI